MSPARYRPSHNDRGGGSGVCSDRKTNLWTRDVYL